MPVFSGNTSTSALSTAYTNPLKIKSFSITNKTGGAVTINVSILYGSTNTWITAVNKSLAANEIYQDDDEKLLLNGHQIYVLVSGSCDYYFTLEKPNE